MLNYDLSVVSTPITFINKKCEMTSETCLAVSRSLSSCNFEALAFALHAISCFPGSSSYCFAGVSTFLPLPLCASRNRSHKLFNHFSLTQLWLVMLFYILPLLLAEALIYCLILIYGENSSLYFFPTGWKPKQGSELALCYFRSRGRRAAPV